MPGNARSGRKRTPTKTLKTRGTFRKDRHGRRADARTEQENGREESRRGSPVELPGLDAVGKDLYQRLLPHFTQVAGAAECDSFQIFALCAAWSLYRAALKEAQSDATDKTFRAAVTAYHRQFDSLAARFGLTPADRAKLESPAAPPDEDAEFFQ